MKNSLRSRKKLKDTALVPEILLSVMSGIYPRKNNYGLPPDSELVEDLARFGVTTRGQFQALMKKHRKALLATDRARLSIQVQSVYKEVFGASHVKEAVRCRFWYAYPALIRTAMELEFGPEAEKYE